MEANGSLGGSGRLSVRVRSECA